MSPGESVDCSSFRFSTTHSHRAMWVSSGGGGTLGGGPAAMAMASSGGSVGGGETLPLHCASPTFVANALPFLAVLRKRGVIG